MIKIIKPADDKDFRLIEKLAGKIWREHYTPIIGAEQVEYMLEKYQSFSAMREQIKNGHEYFIILFDQQAVGYIGFQKRSIELFLSKIYLLKAFRNKGIGRVALTFVEGEAKNAGLEKIELTVNKFNTHSIAAYLRMGFINAGPVVKEIGNGFIMDDYKMVKEL